MTAVLVVLAIYSAAISVSFLVLFALLLKIVAIKTPAGFGLDRVRSAFRAECGHTVYALTPIDLMAVADNHIHECELAPQDAL